MAPFKLRFSKMSKSRSKESRSSSHECDDPPMQQTSTNSRPETPGTEFNIIATGNESEANFTNSPPPSYEHVLQETQLRRSPSEVNEEEQEYREEEENEFSTRQGSIENKSMIVSRVQEGESSLEGATIIVKAPQILHKSSKELYRAIAKQCGISCKMSDQCRCLDCQSHYFDCEYDKDEQEKTDGGLGAGTPMFIAEVMHGTACVIL
ncbi:uncharacterized protein [Chelonus insularis]|uniref:uncharacterized protein n=1 Tax=Chelonus insularis TaxID=460826 RepID=UPI001589B6C8|nr:uncharacterized protein LOC118068411 [Chelonus insularis]